MNTSANLKVSTSKSATSPSCKPLAVMAQRHSNDRRTLDQTTQTFTRKIKKTNAQERNFFDPTHLAHLVLPDTQANASQNQKSQVPPSPPTTQQFGFDRFFFEKEKKSCTIQKLFLFLPT